MIRITLAQMRRSVGRLAAAGIAIVIGTAFVAATLLAGNLITRSTYDSIAARYAAADLVVESAEGAELSPAQLESVATTSGVVSAAPQSLAYQGLTHGNRTIYQGVIPQPDDPRLMPLELTDGAAPSAADEIAVPPDVAERLGLGVGATVDVVRDVPGDPETGELEQVVDPMTISGLVADPKNAYGMSGGAAVVTQDTFDQWGADAAGGEVTYPEASLLLADGADLEAVRAHLATTLGSAFDVVTPDEHAEAAAAELTGGENLMFLIFVLTFASIALLVAGLVITNTFQVLVAQRARTLALLRAVGASKRQVGAGVLLEAAILGVVTSVLGVLVGASLGQLALWVARTGPVAASLPATITVTWQVVAVPIVVGTLVTVAAALVPARVATRVAPLAALRPLDAPTAEKGAGRVRLVLSVLATVIGFALLAGGAALGTVAREPSLGLALGILGGATSFVGVAVSAVFWLPKVTGLAGRLVGSSGPTARLAAANTLRNPRRTASTSTALLIGVTLVAMMSTGAASARTSLTAALDGQFPVDVAVQGAQTDDSGATVLPQTVIDAVEAVDEVAAVALLQSGVATLGDGTSSEEETVVTVQGVDRDAALAALRLDEPVEALAPGTAVVPTEVADAWGLRDGDRLTLTGDAGTVTFDLATSDTGIGEVLVLPADLRALVTRPTTEAMWLALDPGADARAGVGHVQDTVADTGELASVSGAAVERASFEDVVDTALGIVLGLLAVAVVIALIGVANTLSLSVIERRRESATMRAIGVTTGQLRWMLAIEGMLIAGVGAVLGIVLGLVYGWAGSLAALGIMGDVTLSVPWRDVALVAVVALVAGLLASVLPGRSAVRTSPVEALAAE
ncbi:ABC transporter permease [Puerhibacterium puerhi]|uniref:ABC transporter permease n=1 Tax=Puerhibacterium puerhi TaxID=2692623 RepID=UPI00135A45F1|nr:FtsX-like permease family protein [Puerhibacterium puerhi]